MKPIVINEKNTWRISDAIKEAEGRAKERTLIWPDLFMAIKIIEDKLDIPKVAMTGIKVDVDVHAQKFPNAYKYTPMSTHAIIEKTKAGWKLTNVSRDICRTKQFEVTLTEAAKHALIKRVEKF